MKKEICKSCQFFYEWPASNLQGNCRRWAPDKVNYQVLPGFTNPTIMPTDWPSVMAGDWCGEFEEIEKEMTLKDGLIMGSLILCALIIVTALIKWVDWLVK